jgi:uncharacterized protein (TIGR03435 family)
VFLAGGSPLAYLAATAQTRPEFEIADVHVSPPREDGLAVLEMSEGGVVRGGRYEIHKATMLDLIKTAYNVEAGSVFGGPSWLALDRFEVIAKPPAGTTTAMATLMLQFLLSDRFKLVVRKDMKPMPAWVLSKGADKPKLKPADTAGEPGCRAMDRNERVSCHNVTMDTFAASLRAGFLTTLPVLNSTGITGSWDFDLHYTVAGGQFGISDNNPIINAVDKELGLKLELRNTPQPVLVVESVNRIPTANAPEIERSLPALDQFEVASIRQCQAIDLFGARYSAGGQVTTGCLPLSNHVAMAWDLCTQTQASPNLVIGLCSNDVAGAPKWMTSRYFNIVAKAPIPITSPAHDENYHAMLRHLLVDRFKMITHYEDRLVDAYTLVAAKPKLTKADPSSRSECRSSGVLVGIPTVVTCRNVTMAQFAEELNHHSVIVASHRRVVDASGIQGAWDLTLTYRVRPGGGAVAADGVAPDPGGGVSLFDAIEQQLGLKLEEARRRMPVFVIDHVEETPTEN